MPFWLQHCRLRLYIKGGDFSASSFTSVEPHHHVASTFFLNHKEQLSFCKLSPARERDERLSKRHHSICCVATRWRHADALVARAINGIAAGAVSSGCSRWRTAPVPPTYAGQASGA